MKVVVSHPQEVVAVACLTSIPMVSAFAAALLCNERPPSSCARSFQVLTALAVLEARFFKWLEILKQRNFNGLVTFFFGTFVDPFLFEKKHNFVNLEDLSFHDMSITFF